MQQNLVNLFVDNIPVDIPHGMFYDAFRQYGRIRDYIMQPSKTHNTLVGLVEYANESDAKEALESMNDSILSGNTIKVRYAIRKHSANSKSSRASASPSPQKVKSKQFIEEYSPMTQNWHDLTQNQIARVLKEIDRYEHAVGLI